MRFRQFVLACVGITALVAVMASVWTPASAQQTPSMTYKLDEAWPKSLSFPAGKSMGGAVWTEVDEKGTYYIFRRCLVPCPEQHPIAGRVPGNVVILDKNGKYVREIGTAKEAHGLHVDGDGNIFLTDVQEHTVTKYSPEGKLLMTLGTPGVKGTTNTTFNMPTQAIVDRSNGNIFVADGYGNQRIVKFDKNGKFIKTWGTKGLGPGELRLPHGLALDGKGRLYVGDRCGLTASNCKDNTLAVFDTDGKFLERWNLNAYSLDFDKDGRFYVGDLPNRKVLIVDPMSGKVLAEVAGAGGHSNSVDPTGDYIFSNSFSGAAAGVRRYTRK